MNQDCKWFEQSCKEKWRIIDSDLVAFCYSPNSDQNEKREQAGGRFIFDRIGPLTREVAFLAVKLLEAGQVLRYDFES